MNSGVTTGQLLTDVNNRPKPNALKPSEHGFGRRNSHQTQNSQSGFMKDRMPGSTKSALMAAGQSTISTGKLHGGSKQASRNAFFPKESVMAANMALGRLPTLGLNQIKLEEFTDDDNNLFRVHKKTEHLLVARELEREFKDLNKFEKDNLRIHEKGISTRIDRPGTIRVINNIPALKQDGDKRNRLSQQNADMQLKAQNKQKLNIFDAADSQVLKSETLQRLGHDERATVNVGNSSHSSSFMSSQKSSVYKPKAIEYLNKGGQQQETVRDFIDNSRKILMTQIAINDKSNETELLNEYIIMEKEKLDEGRKTFDEDKEKYEKFKMDLQAKSQQTDDEVKRVIQQIDSLTQEINDFKKNEQEIDSKMQKVEDEMTTHKKHKKFLDLIAIASKNKKWVNQKRRNMRKAMKNSVESTENSIDHPALLAQSTRQTQQRVNDATFVTQTATVMNQGPPAKRGDAGNIKNRQQVGGSNASKIQSIVGGAAAARTSNVVTIDDDVMEVVNRNHVFSDNLQNMSDDEEFNGSDIDLNASYSDSDNEIPLEDKKFWEYLQKLEENNLFEMNLFQDRTQTLEKISMESQKRIDDKRTKIRELENNMQLLKQRRDARQGRFSYYQNMLNDKNKQQERKAVAKNIYAPGKPKSTGIKQRDVKAGAIEVDTGAMSAMGMTMGSLGAPQGRRGLTLHQTAFNQHLYEKGASRDDVKSINETLMDLFDKTRDKQEEGMGEREGRGKVLSEIEMINNLKRVELRFQDLLEKRSICRLVNEDALKMHENEIRTKNKKADLELAKDKLDTEKEKKNTNLQSRIDKKKNKIVPRPIRAIERSRKPMHKGTKVVSVKVPPEVEEMRRYLGIQPDDWNFEAQPDKKEEEKSANGNNQ